MRLCEVEIVVLRAVYYNSPFFAETSEAQNALDYLLEEGYVVRCGSGSIYQVTDKALRYVDK